MKKIFILIFMILILNFSIFASQFDSDYNNANRDDSISWFWWILLIIVIYFIFFKKKKGNKIINSQTYKKKNKNSENKAEDKKIISKTENISNHEKKEKVSFGQKVLGKMYQVQELQRKKQEKITKKTGRSQAQRTEDKYWRDKMFEEEDRMFNESGGKTDDSGSDDNDGGED